MTAVAPGTWSSPASWASRSPRCAPATATPPAPSPPSRLYLHHLALGEADAAWWRKQTTVRTRRSPITENLPVTYDDTDRSTPTLLRVLGQLLSTTKRCSSEVIDALMAFVPYAVAVGHREDPDLELPTPYTGFAEHITIVLAATASIRTSPAPPQPNEELGTLSRRDQAASFRKNRRTRRASPTATGCGTAKALQPLRRGPGVLT
ncbi:hypothetical protein AB0M29_38935 [Streptomyces sp. NPDC051976]|uniref:hypothetical protein n=1 Tax=Streptomyces sp. NPDC051976 TaxID=3154947 RepID=UPI003440A5A4